MELENSKPITKDKKPNGCSFIFYFFILVLLGMILVLFIKIQYFLNV
jgi:hypothetical protein